VECLVLQATGMLRFCGGTEISGPLPPEKLSSQTKCQNSTRLACRSVQAASPAHDGQRPAAVSSGLHRRGELAGTGAAARAPPPQRVSTLSRAELGQCKAREHPDLPRPALQLCASPVEAPDLPVRPHPYEAAASAPAGEDDVACTAAEWRVGALRDDRPTGSTTLKTGRSSIRVRLREIALAIAGTVLGRLRSAAGGGRVPRMVSHESGLVGGSSTSSPCRATSSSLSW
jgi:hypothetical protein